MTGAARAGGRLPTFIIVGTAKAGTTTLARWLALHPEVHMAPEKEVRYFNVHHGRGEAWYRSRFTGAREAHAVGEATPLYLSDPAVPPRIAELVPGARLVALLREPVGRAWSHYWFMRSIGAERSGFERRLADELLDPATAPVAFSYLAPGCYMAALLRFERHFGREAMLVLLLEDLRDDPAGSFAAVCRHIGVDDRFSVPATEERVHNAAAHVRSVRLQALMAHHRIEATIPLVGRRLAAWNRVRRPNPVMDADLKARLQSWYERQNAGLAEWLGRDLSSWG